MKSQHPFHPTTDPVSRWRIQPLPIGLRIACVKASFENSDHQDHRLDISLPDFEEKGMVLTFIQYKGDLQIVAGPRGERRELASPGLALLSVAGKPLHFQSSVPVHFSAAALFVPADWVGFFLKDNPQFEKIEEMLQEEDNVITCRLGRRQLSLFSDILTFDGATRGNLLEMQNHALSLLEYFLCNRHRNLLGAGASSGIDNEDDLTLIREVESYISEYYCSDTFTVDSILKKTYTSYHRLNFLFKSIHGMTISEYIRNKRIEKSKEMIAANAKSISQIAYEIGYSSISNYILAFKKIYQITPGKYKKQMEV
jgi:AraC-like DNA-binding protein